VRPHPKHLQSPPRVTPADSPREEPVKKLLPIETVASRLKLTEGEYERRTTATGKVKLSLLKSEPRTESGRPGKLILVTATTPTTSGEGKTVTAIGLVQGFAAIGKNALITSREPSLGPVFGMKGGAAGGGQSQIEPAANINLHFHGDMHAITSAHNLLSALIDAHLFHGNDLDLDPAAITWPRTLDMNDRALRKILVSVTPPSADPNKPQRDGSNRPSGFVITAASEIMAILSLAQDRNDLRRRLSNIVIGANRKGEPIRAPQLDAVGAMMALLTEAIEPNLAQTTDGTPAFVHCGPFANIAHGTSSVVSQQIGRRLADYIINETGFASDLGFEKYMDLVLPMAGIKPSLAVVVTTVKSVREQGEGDLERGFENLARHIAIVRGFNLPAIVAINRFPNDTEADLHRIEQFCKEHGAEFALSEAFTRGGEGAAALARKVVEVIDANPDPEPTRTYDADDSILDKLNKVARKIYGADGIELSEQAKSRLARYEQWGYGNLPVCIAKTQYSFSDDPKRKGAPTGWTLHISDISLSAGAGFLVVTSGTMVLMPGLPKVSRAVEIDVDENGEITGMS
jgi:formate--tetrahydrofolate ligase